MHKHTRTLHPQPQVPDLTSGAGSSDENQPDSAQPSPKTVKSDHDIDRQRVDHSPGEVEQEGDSDLEEFELIDITDEDFVRDVDAFDPDEVF